MIRVGITGSIGMGKSTLATMLQKQGIPVHDSDRAVHEALKTGAGGYTMVLKAFGHLDAASGLIDKETGDLSRQVLGKIVFEDAKKRVLLEQILHPIVRQSQDRFIKTMRQKGRLIVGLDIPLLFETGAESRVDRVIVVSAPFALQKKRVLARPGMSEEKFHAILDRQMADGEKCARADYVVQTGLGLAYTMRQVKKIVHDLRKVQASANKGTHHVNQELETHLVEL